MKKLIALIAALALMITAVCAVPVMADEEDITGVWYIQSMNQGGTEIGAGILTSMGMNMMLTFNEDGTCSMTMTSSLTGTEETQSKDGTWTLNGTDGTMAFEGGETPFTLEDGCIKIESDGQVMTLGREAATGTSTLLAPAVTDPELKDFDGKWNVTTYVAYGIPLPLTMMGSSVVMDIEDGKVLYHEDLLDIENNFEVTDTLEYEFPAELKDDGTLFVDFLGEELMAQIAPGASGISLTLREDGDITGLIPEVVESIAVMNELMESSGDEAEGEAAGDSEGSSGDSASIEAGMEMYLLLEKAE